MPNENPIFNSEEVEKASKTTVRTAVVVEVGSGVTTCELQYDNSKYSQLVEEFRK